MGFNLIEIMIVILILGIVSGFGGFYFISLWREHRISVQHYFLQREARYALDFIINGQMKDDMNEIYRYGGIIASHDANIVEINENIDEIFLYRIQEDPNEAPKIVHIYPDTNGQDSLWIDYNDRTNHKIIPTGASEEGRDNPYTIRKMLYEKDGSLINIEILLDQNVYARKLSVNMESRVKLRNQ